jgi:hypothetical protein
MIHHGEHGEHGGWRKIKDAIRRFVLRKTATLTSATGAIALSPREDGR